ncbi:MAG: citrate (Si)-synthase [Candidatus Accumulibacter sp.]|uniref:citrate synthase n=1 Tax=Accumulibacter sp. TaxID=2053492 RepID=UPI001A3C3F7F|nr:citrate synthase [Accumulibacter sp.]MBL8390452.1 citrate (Si)-synthase [Accumulibacter sp.]HRD86970.1 citrate synthase [Accumulibacter sp.]
MASGNRRAFFRVDGEPAVELPLLRSTQGSRCLDIRHLGASSGYFAYDSGFASTASCRSKISLVDAERGELLYRGYPVEQLATQCDFLEVAYLLRNGELPDHEQLASFAGAIRRQAALHEQMVKLYEGFRRDARPMAVMVGVVGALSAFDHAAGEFSDPAQRLLRFERVVARLPTIVAMAYKYSIGQPFMKPRPDLSYSANFLYMMFATPREEYTPNPVLVRAIDRMLTLQADCGQDAATATVRMAGSSGANPYACLSAAIACLAGKALGGTSEACLAILAGIGDAARAGGIVALARELPDGARLPGFGHGLCGENDPRLPLMRESCAELLLELGLEEARFGRLVRAVEKIALEDRFFVERQLQPNADFYGAIAQQALGVPPSMFACTLAMARAAGWMAHWEEMLTDPEYRIARPRQLYTGTLRRPLPAALAD